MGFLLFVAGLDLVCLLGFCALVWATKRHYQRRREQPDLPEGNGMLGRVVVTILSLTGLVVAGFAGVAACFMLVVAVGKMIRGSF